MTGVYGCQQDGRGTMNNSLWYRGRALCGQVCKVFLLFMFIHPHYVKSDCNAFETALPPNMRIPSLPETTPAGYSLFNVTLTSSDQVTLDQANPPGFFVFNITNKINYNLQLKQNLDLESLSPGVASVSVRVVCNPGNWKSTLRIQISAVNEFPPMFIDSPYQVNVSEMTPIGTTVFNLANRVRDPDNTMNPIQMLYTIDGSDAFRIDGTAVVTNRTFDYDLGTKKYIVNLTATERTPERKSNSTELTISILNEDDLNPKFTQELYNITLDEGNYSTALFNSNPAIHAVDPDSGNSLGVQYSLINGTGYDYGNLFTLLLNGSLKVSGHVGLNPPVYSLSIKAFQTDRPKERYDTATLFITVRDINDHAPIMSKKFYTARVAENSPSGFIVLEVSASDEDTGRNGVFEFDLVQQGSLFDIQTIGTKGWLRIRGSLDREHDSTQTIQVYAKETLTAEHRQSPLSNITIIVTDVNDNSPVFSNTSYNFQIQKNASIGKTIGMVSATDIDEGKNGSVTYEIQGTQADWFSIHNTTGIISVHLNLSDVSAGPIYFFVIAQDQAPKPYIRQTIVPVIVEILDVNTGPPIFINITNPVYISENQGKGALLLQLSAKDPDRSANGKLTYTINEGNSNGTFTINTRCGLITLRKMLDRETCPSYNLTVQVSDGELTTSTVIEVLVRDLNDNAPQFTQRIYIFNITEEQAAPAVVGRVIAHDRDEGRNKEITFQSLGIPFDMNATTGVITTKGPLDRENLTSYSFFVMATDRGQPPLSSVSQIEVNVKDINDNPPVFDPSIVKLKYNEGMMLSFTTQAHDRDSGENKLVKYFKEDGDTLFSVSSDGLVSTALLKHGQFNVTVVAYNTEPYTCNCKNATLTLVIDVSDINNNPPVFNTKLYNKTIPEGRYTDKPPILTVAATDNDTDATFVYKIISGNNNSTFYLNPISGNLYPRRELDYDPPVNDREFNLTVQAVDPSDKEKNDSTQVLIYITDTNDNSPIFDRDTYTCRISESLQPHEQFDCQVNATDIDSTKNGNITYTMKTPNVPFTVDLKSGELKLSANINYDSQKKYTVSIMAADTGTLSQTSTCTVSIEVVNENDHTPYFIDAPYDMTLLQTIQPGHVVGVVKAADADGDTLVFSLKNHTDSFQLTNMGILKTKKDLNCTQHYYIWLQVNDSIHINETVISITSIQVNQFAPSFMGVNQRILNENATKGEFVLRLSSVDYDCGEGGNISYSITGGNSNNAFKISNNDVVVACTGCLDYDTQKEYEILVKAEDGGNPSRMNFTVLNITLADVNDEAPKFDRTVYAARVLENEKNGTVILQVIATDQDTPENELKYSLVTVMPGFVLSSRGVLTKNGVLDADRPTVNSIIIGNVSVKDGRNTGFAQINITILDVNDNAPVLHLKSSNISVPENCEIGNIISVVKASDEDRTNNGFTYWLTKTEGKFEINVSNGSISVTDYFDRSMKDIYNMTVHVSDHGIPPQFDEAFLTVNIEDSNNAPVFWNPPYTFNVAENASVNTVIGVIFANDSDRGTSGTVRYEIIKGNEDKMFYLDSISGNISVINHLDFERSNGPKYIFTVIAKDLSFVPKTAKTSVTINLENVPEAPQWPLPLPVVLIQMSGSCNPSKITAFSRDVTYVSSSDDGVQYSLLNLEDVFSIESSTGIIKTNGSLTAGRDYLLQLKACNANYTNLCSQANLTIDVRSDNSLFSFCPSFITASVKEDVRVGYLVVDMNTTSGDSGINYTVVAGDQNQIFSISSTQGLITTAKPLDREKMDHYTLLVVGQSKNQTAEAQVIIRVLDVKDTPPRFERTEYQGKVSEAANISDPVLVDTDQHEWNLTVVALDPDLNTQLTYKINGSSDISNGSFTIGRFSGTISIKKKIDRERLPADLHDKYIFQVTASDEKNTATATVTVHILDENDNSPKFQRNIVNISILENTSIGSVIYRAAAIDLDYVDRGQIQYSISPKDVFVIDSHSGNISVQLHLNRESVASYSLKVDARDLANNTGKMELNIFITDANDNVPQFNQTQYEFDVFEGISSINQSMTVEAHDNDIGNNSVITFHIVKGNEDGIFHIESNGNKGILTIVKELDRENKKWNIENGNAIIHLTLEAIDGGFPPLKNTSDVTVRIFDVNDNSPQFSSKEYNSTISEDAKIGSSLHMISKIVATDPDNGVNGTEGIRYSLLTTNTPFLMNSTSGQVIVNSRGLDREKISVYMLQIEAKDAKGSGNTENATLFVYITDINDAVPVFPVSNYTFNMSEAANPSTFVGQVVAFDNDVNGNESVHYTLISGDYYRFFIDRITGILRVAGRLDREEKSVYNLNISANDGKHSSFVTVVIIIEDVNDNCPSFTQSEVRLQVDENKKDVTLVTLTATDPDSGASGNVSYFLNNTDIEEFFSISSSGDLRTITKIDREKNDSFVFHIYASDHGQPPCISYIDVIVKVTDKNDNDPMFCVRDSCNNSPINVSILDKSPVQSVVTLANAKDADAGENGVITFSLLGPLNNYFKIDENSGLVTVFKSLRNVLMHGLHSPNNIIELKIVATDNGTVPRNNTISLNIRIETVMDDVPIFEESLYTFTVKENLNIGSSVGVVKAHFINGTSGTLSYSIIDTRDVSEVFVINDLYGNISTKVKLDRETQSSYNFIVQVRDGRTIERTAFAVVTVNVSDENDNVPQFLQDAYNVNIEENIKKPSLVNITATDADSGENGRITYSIQDNAYETLFAIDRNTGNLKLNGTLDREEKYDYLLNVVATDHNGLHPHSAVTTVHITVIDRNDEYPEFQNTPYVIFIEENNNAISSIVNVSAIDKDAGLNSQVIYRLENGFNYFQINAIDGCISSLGPLDYEHQKEYHLVVMAHDLGSPPLNRTTDVVVYVNNTHNTKPKFTKLLYMSEVAIGTGRNTSLVVSIDAGSGDFYYNITEGNVDGLFYMNPSTGGLLVAKEPTLVGQHLFTIKAFDKVTPQSSSSAQVLVTVVEPKVTFTEDKYEAHIKENTAPPVMIIDLNSSAEKQGLNVMYTLIGGPPDKFSVNASTGQVYCMKELDREHVAQYILHVKVSLIESASTRHTRSVRNDIAKVVVNVYDVNDNDPVFLHPRTYIENTAIFGIPKSAERNYPLATLLVMDKDEGNNRRVLFKLTDDQDMFAIYNKTGQIISLQPVAKAKADSIFLKATATDNNGKGRSDNISIKVVILPDTQRFGLIVGISHPEFSANKQLFIGNLSEILDLDVQLEESMPDFINCTQSLHWLTFPQHPHFTAIAVYYQDHVGTIDGKSSTDLYVHAFNRQTGNALSYDEVAQKIKSKVKAIDDIFNSHHLFRISSPTTPGPIIVTITPRVNTKDAYTVSKAEIAILVIAGLLFFGSIIAIVVVLRIWKRHKAYLLKQNLAQKARNRQTHINIDQDGGTDEGFNETNVDSDNVEAVDLDIKVDADEESRDFNPNMLLRPTQMSEKSTLLFKSNAEVEVQEKVFVFGNEGPDFETIALRKLVARREMLDNIVMKNGESLDSGIEHNQEETREDNDEHCVTEQEQEELVEDMQHMCVEGVQNQPSNGIDLPNQNNNNQVSALPPDPTPDYSNVVRFAVKDELVGKEKQNTSESESPSGVLGVSSQNNSDDVDETDIAVSQIAYPCDTPHIDVMTRL